MPFREYQTNWVEELPEIGSHCPLCPNGFLECNDFISKKGEKFWSVKCDSCFTKWIIGHKQYPPKEKTEKEEIPLRTHPPIETKVIPVSGLSPDDWKKLEKWLGVIRGDIKTLKDDLEKKSVIYPDIKQPTE